MKVLIVVDMQNDFISGALGSEAAQAIVPKIKEKIDKYKGDVVFTRDTHHKDYLTTQEGINLPVKHCIVGTKGWQICDELKLYTKEGRNLHDKATFGSMELPNNLRYRCLGKNEELEEIELCGLCTDICVISNAMILKAAYPETKITVDASCCAGVTPASHNIALQAMKAVQINIVGEESVE